MNVPADHTICRGGHVPQRIKQSQVDIMAPARTTKSERAAQSAEVFAGVRLTHPDRVLFPDEKITKRDLAAVLLGGRPHFCCRTSTRAAPFPGALP